MIRLVDDLANQQIDYHLPGDKVMGGVETKFICIMDGCFYVQPSLVEIYKKTQTFPRNSFSYFDESSP